MTGLWSFLVALFFLAVVFSHGDASIDGNTSTAGATPARLRTRLPRTTIAQEQHLSHPTLYHCGHVQCTYGSKSGRALTTVMATDGSATASTHPRVSTSPWELS